MDTKLTQVLPSLILKCTASTTNGIFTKVIWQHGQSPDLCVIENEADIPTEGKFVIGGRIPTDKDNNWAICEYFSEHNGQRYMILVRWQKRRIDSRHNVFTSSLMKIRGLFLLTSP